MTLVLANLVALWIVYTMTMIIVESAQICLDAKATFAKSQKAGVTVGLAVANLLLFPLVLYVVYFMNFGKTRRQARMAAWSFLLIVMPCVGDLVYSFRPSLPGGYVDAELVVSAILVLCLFSVLLYASILRWRIIHPRAPEVLHLRCERCGYNLTGLTEPRCPECGTPFDPKLLAGESQGLPRKKAAPIPPTRE